MELITSQSVMWKKNTEMTGHEGSFSCGSLSEAAELMQESGSPAFLYVAAAGTRISEFRLDLELVLECLGSGGKIIHFEACPLPLVA